MDEITNRTTEVDRAREAVLVPTPFIRSRFVLDGDLECPEDDCHYCLVFVVGKT